MKKLLDLFRRGHTPDSVALSAYLDRRLTPNDTAAVDVHLETCAACRTQLAGMGEARALLRTIPQTEAPRSFRLRQADVEAPAPIASPAPWMRALPALGGVAAAVFVVAVAVELAGSGGSDAQLTASRSAAELTGTSQPAGAIAADSGGEAYPDGDAAAPLPVAPEDASSDASGPPQADGAAADAATSPATLGDDAGLNSGVEKSPDVEAARDANTSSDDDGWPLARYVAMFSAVAAIAAAGAWLGFTFERRRR